MVAISFFFSLALDPAVRALTRRYGWRRGSAVGAVYVGGVLLAAFMIAVLISSIAELARTIGANGAEWPGDVQERIDDLFGVEVFGSSAAGDLASSTDAAPVNWSEEAFGAVLGIASAGIGLVFSLATIAMFTFYLTAAVPQVQRAVLRLFSPTTKERVGWT